MDLRVTSGLLSSVSDSWAGCDRAAAGAPAEGEGAGGAERGNRERETHISPHTGDRHAGGVCMCGV